MPNKQSALHDLVKEKNFKKLYQHLLKDSSNINRQFEDQTPLRIAITEECDNKIVDLLLRHGADPNVATYGETILHDAVRIDKIEIVKLLIHYGANVNSKSSSGITPLHKAFHNTKSNFNLVKYLILNGADLKA